MKLFVQQYYPVFSLEEMRRIDRTLGGKYQVNERVFSLVYKVIENDTVTVEEAGIHDIFKDRQKFDIGFENLMGLAEYACNRRSRQPQTQLMQAELMEEYFEFYRQLLQEDTPEALVNAAGIDRRVAGKVRLNEKQIARVNQMY